MPGVSESTKLVDGVVRLRRAERIPAVAADVRPVRRELEARLGPTLSRSRAARILGVSQTALDRWVEAGQVPVVVTPRGRREVPRQFVVELREAIDGLLAEGRRRHLLGAALAARREAAAGVGGEASSSASSRPATEPPVTAPRSVVPGPITQSSPTAWTRRRSKRRALASSSSPPAAISIPAMPTGGATYSPARATRSPARSSPNRRPPGTFVRTAPFPACSTSRSGGGSSRRTPEIRCGGSSSST